jgi:hypothetical protein
MNARGAAILAALTFIWSMPAHAESVRCSGGTVNEGDSRLSVAYKCGNPMLQDSFCRPIQYVSSPAQSTRQGFAVALPFCEQVDEWLYDRGPGNLMVKVRFRSAVVETIVYGRFPQ